MFQKSRVRFGSAVVALVLLATSCGGGDSESSNRQRNTALAPCVTATVGEGLQIGTSGANVAVAIGVCSGVTAVQFIDENGTVSDLQPISEGTTTPLNLDVTPLTAESPTAQRKITVRASGVNNMTLAEDIVLLKVDESGLVSVEVTPGDVSEAVTTTPTTSDLPPAGLASVANLAMTFKETDGVNDIYTLSFDYPSGELARVDGFLMEHAPIGASDQVRLSTFPKGLWVTGEGDRLTIDISSVAGFVSGTTYELLLSPYVDDPSNSDMQIPDRNATRTTKFIAGAPASGDVASPSEPQTPTKLALTEDDVLTWVPARTSETNFSFDAEKYPYMYMVNWRRTDAPNDPYQRVTAESATYSLNASDFVVDVEYEFVVAELINITTGDLTVSGTSAPLVTIPFTAADMQRIEDKRAAELEKSRLAAIECLKTAPQLELLLKDPSSRTENVEAPVNSDDEIELGVIHPCEMDTVANIEFEVKEVDPTTKRRLFSSTGTNTGLDVKVQLPGNRLAPGSHTFIIEAVWPYGNPFSENDSSFTPASTEWTFNVAPGLKAFPRRCYPEDVTLTDRKLTINCEGVTRIRWRESDVSSRNVGINVDLREVTLPVFPDGWNRFGIRVSQNLYSLKTFSYMICQRNCDNTALEPEFTVAVEGDTANIAVNQNECGGKPKSVVTEYVKITDNLFYSFNQEFGVAGPKLIEGQPLAINLQPFTEALRATRRDYCGSGKRSDTIYSFVKLDRPKVEPLDLEKLTLPPQTEVLLEPDDVVTAEQQNIAVPVKTEAVTIPSDVIEVLAPSGGTVTVAVGTSEPELLIDGWDLSLALPPTAKTITFRTTDSKGRVTEVTKPIVRLPETEVVEVVEDAGQTVPKAQATTAAQAAESYGSSPIIFVLAGLAALVLALIALQRIRRKA